MRFKITTATKVVTFDKKVINYATPPAAVYIDTGRYEVLGGASGTVIVDIESGTQIYSSATLASVIALIDAATSTTVQITF